MNRSAAEAYKTQAIMTAPPARLVAMCYERAIGSLKDAIRAIEANDIQSRCDNATRAANIIAHLWSTLDLEKGGEIAANLANIYGFAMRRMNDINMKNDPKAAQDIVNLLTPLWRSWDTLANRGEPMPVAAPALAPAPRRSMAQPSSTRPLQADRPGGGIAISI